MATRGDKDDDLFLKRGHDIGGTCGQRQGSHLGKQGWWTHILAKMQTSVQDLLFSGLNSTPGSQTQWELPEGRYQRDEVGVQATHISWWDHRLCLYVAFVSALLTSLWNRRSALVAFTQVPLHSYREILTASCFFIFIFLTECFSVTLWLTRIWFRSYFPQFTSNITLGDA